LLTRSPPRPTPFPYTTLFRSAGGGAQEDGRGPRPEGAVGQQDQAGLRVGRGNPAEHLDAAGEPGRTIPGQDDVLGAAEDERAARSEEHTSELQSRSDLVCRLL